MGAGAARGVRAKRQARTGFSLTYSLCDQSGNELLLQVGAGSGPASITPDPVTACASFASTGSDAHSRSCSKPSPASKPTAFTWSASRSVSTPRRRPASSCSTSSAPSRTSSAGSSPSEPATASPRPGNAVEHRVDRRSTRRRFRPLRNSSRPDCHPAKPPNSSE